MRGPSGERVAIKCSKICVRRDQMAIQLMGGRWRYFYATEKHKLIKTFALSNFSMRLMDDAVWGDS